MSLYDAWTRYDAWTAFATNVCKLEYVAPGGAKPTPSECEEIRKAAIRVCLYKLTPPIFWHDLHTDGEPDTSATVMRLRTFLQARYKALDGPRCLACQMALVVRVGSTLVEGVRSRSASALAVPRVAQCLDSLYLQVRLAGQATRGTTSQRKSGAHQ
jgi:hypothetical protein